MRTSLTAIGLVLGLALGLAFPGQAGAGAGFTIRIGTGHDIPPKSHGVKPRATTPWVVPPPERHSRPHHRRDHDRYDRYRRGGRYLYGSPYLGHYGGSYYSEPAPSAPPLEVVAPPVAVAPPEPAPIPDPRGPLFLAPARGVAVDAEDWQVGDVLPAGVPQVTLDWRRYDLPEPPPGRLYARVGRDVLLITASDRVIESVLPPG
jgi:Ni/Co efflux regulator RcnB